MALGSMQTPPGVCGVVLEGAANTDIVQASGKSSRVKLFKGLILFSQGFAGVGKNTYPECQFACVQKACLVGRSEN